MDALNLALAPLCAFAFVSSITPGPNNLLIMRSGARFGLRRTLRHIVGIEAGLIALMVLSQLGVGAVLLAWPAALKALRIACSAYLLWLAWLMLRDSGPAEVRGAPGAANARPMGVGAAALFQLVNPKAWMMAVTGISAFSTRESLGALDLVAVAVVFVAIGAPCMLGWTAWGVAFDRVLRRPAARRAFSIGMAVITAAPALVLLRGDGA
ncbi:LysE family translocator [bacterium]|nr:MAG: LysE family translocator [bacterium]